MAQKEILDGGLGVDLGSEAGLSSFDLARFKLGEAETAYGAGDKRKMLDLLREVQVIIMLIPEE